LLWELGGVSRERFKGSRSTTTAAEVRKRQVEMTPSEEGLFGGGTQTPPRHVTSTLQP